MVSLARTNEALLTEARVAVVVDPLIKDRLAEGAECRSNTFWTESGHSASGLSPSARRPLRPPARSSTTRSDR